MPRPIIWLIAAAVLVAFPFRGSTVRAQTVPVDIPVSIGGPVLPPPVGASTGPVIWLAPRTSDQFLATRAYPVDFRFADEIVGVGFRPAERVTVSATGGSESIPPTTAVADAAGNFQVAIDFTWVFCGPGGTSSAPPVFTASGDSGSSAQVSETSPPCPALIPVLAGPVPVPAAGESSTGTTSSTSAQLVLDLRGFGFLAGESVTFRLIDPLDPGMAPSESRHLKADSQGRLQLSVSIPLPDPCSEAPATRGIATGNKGTSVAVRLFRVQPEVMCLPAGNSGIAPPSAESVNRVPAGNADELSVRLASPTVPRGHQQRAFIQSGETADLSLVIHYAGGTSPARAAQIPAGGTGTLEWTVPDQVRPGKAWLQLTDASSQTVLRANFVVR